MSNRLNILYRLIYKIETAIDRIRYRLMRKYKKHQLLKIVAYRGIGNHRVLKLMGRVLEDDNRPVNSEQSVWNNLRISYYRFETDEVPGVKVRGEFRGKAYETVTDEEGYFRFEIHPDIPLDDGKPWHTIQLNLIDPDIQCQPVEGRVLVAGENSRFGIISDMDDTVLVTNATKPLKAMYLTFLENVNARVPFKGVAAFYHALIENHGGQNPIYYVSSSPWNLYEMLTEFMNLNNIPQGPLMLRDIGIDSEKFIASSHGDHKRKQILSILELNPDLDFILIGDSGQHDPEIYRQIALELPDRILAIYIRDASSEKRDAAVEQISAELINQNEAMVFVTDTISAAEDAARRGFITKASIDSVREDSIVSSVPITAEN